MISFALPWMLLGLGTLPILWWILRAVPPAAIRRRFPAVSLLLGIEDAETTPDKTPWWLLILRMVALAMLIVGFANPVLNPNPNSGGSGRLLIALDGGWASAEDWSKRLQKVTEISEQAIRAGRPVGILRLTDRVVDNGQLQFGNGTQLVSNLAGFEPDPFAPDFNSWSESLEQAENGSFDTIWLSDGIDHAGRTQLLNVFKASGEVQVIEGATDVLALHPLSAEGGKLVSKVSRLRSENSSTGIVDFRGPDPSGIPRILASVPFEFAEGSNNAEFEIEIPTELRNRIRQIDIQNVESAGAVSLTDDSLKRRKVALLGSSQQQEGSVLTSDLHFLHKALTPTADVIEAPLEDVIAASANVIVLADVATIADDIETKLVNWVQEGGVLVRFAGPRMAAAGQTSRTEHPLLPVRLRGGGRTIGGAMSWGDPKGLRDFEEDSPFFGLKIPLDVLIETQVMAQPDPNLANRVLARIDDGTPLVTAKDLGLGRVMLFHVTANAEWSNLPLSGLFVDMLERLAISTRSEALAEQDLVGRQWVPETVLDGFGNFVEVSGIAGLDGKLLVERRTSVDVKPGLYANGQIKLAINAVTDETTLDQFNWPIGTRISGLEKAQQISIKPILLTLGVLLLAIDAVASIWIGGRMPRFTKAGIASLLVLIAPFEARADDARILEAVNNTILAYVETGNDRLDETSAAGLLGLTSELFRRTSIEPIAPIGVDLETDELSVYPFLYWPVVEGQNPLSETANAKINRFLRNGGLILFDTRDAHLGRGISGTANGRVLQQIAAKLDIPALEPIPNDHVLTRAFYLLQDFPGRAANNPVWVEAAPQDADQTEGVPFRNLNDGVTPVVIGGNDWASAWAIDDQGRFIFPVGRGFAGEQQREFAIRFGINLIMHVMTGNYKSDQVHVPALLKRLGQ